MPSSPDSSAAEFASLFSAVLAADTLVTFVLSSSLLEPAAESDLRFSGD